MLEPPLESVPGERVFVEGYDEQGTRFPIKCVGVDIDSVLSSY